jgi:serine/threonine protein kinase
MSDDGRNSEQPRESVLDRVDRVCDEFEAAWKAWRSGETPDIKDYLDRVKESERSKLLKELLRLDVDYRSRVKQSVPAAQYRFWFPGQEQLIDQVFARSNASNGNAPGAETVERGPAPETQIDVGRIANPSHSPVVERGAAPETQVDSQQTGPERAHRELEAPAADPVQDLPVIPGYKVLAILGRGGMGVVLKARELKHDRLVALKMIRGWQGTHVYQLARFRIEAEAVACLAHPNIVDLYDVGVCEGYPYLTLEYAPGGSLANRLAGKPQDSRWATELARTLALALQHAHERSILHRDLKPSNILLMEDGTPKIGDFGLAKFSRPMREVSEQFATVSARYDNGIDPLTAELHRLTERLGAQCKSERTPEDPIQDLLTEELCRELLGSFGPEMIVRALPTLKGFVAELQQQRESTLRNGLAPYDELTRSGAIMGTLAYMAPEQAWGDLRNIGPATDVYALGVVLYEMLTGQPPFNWKTIAEFEYMWQRPKAIVPKVAPDLEAIVMKCLEKGVAARYATAAELAADLQRFLDGYPVLATLDMHTPNEIQEDLRPTVDFAENKLPERSRTRSWWQFWK